MVLTFVRTSELLEACWDQFDLEKADWHIPAERMKMRKALFTSSGITSRVPTFAEPVTISLILAFFEIALAFQFFAIDIASD